jgi:hypothetical protein
MLKRVTGELFRARIGETIQIRAVATHNPGSDIASFEYADGIVENDTGSTSQCTFDVEPGINQFQAVVVFAAGAGATAQYDLFEIDDNGDPQPLDEFVNPDGSTPMIGFGIQGTAAVAKGVAAKAAKKAAKKVAKKAKTTKKAAKRVTRAKKSAKPAAKAARRVAKRSPKRAASARRKARKR